MLFSYVHYIEWTFNLVTTVERMWEIKFWLITLDSKGSIQHHVDKKVSTSGNNMTEGWQSSGTINPEIQLIGMWNTIGILYRKNIPTPLPFKNVFFLFL